MESGAYEVQENSLTAQFIMWRLAKLVGYRTCGNTQFSFHFAVIPSYDHWRVFNSDEKDSDKNSSSNLYRHTAV